jgi:cysteinyl-tRNA synthetase
MTREKEEFKSIEPGKVRMYVCGPTVYDYLHVGNFVGAIFFNLVRSWLEKRDYDVNFVYNYTDVDDKIINRANKEGVDSKEIAEKYIEEFKKDYSSLGLKPHTSNPRVTEHMDHIIDFIKKLVEKKKAYSIDGDVYYDVKSFENYGKLSNKKLDELAAGYRVEIDDRKHHVADFALWKASKAGEPAWESPWGKGRPGWHIECSAMNHSIHGEQIDIHGGGLDLVFPHHENEIAQSEGLTGKTFAKYWMHNNMLQFGSVKMSKSLGNIRTGRSFMEEFNPEVLKFLVLSSHYRSPIDFSQQQIDRAISNLAKFYSAMANAKSIVELNLPLVPVAEKFIQALEKAESGIEKALDDDFNSPMAMAELYEILKLYNSICRNAGSPKAEHKAVAETFMSWLKKQGEIMALFQESAPEFLVKLDDILLRRKKLDRALIDQKVKERAAARAAKDYAKGDTIRDELVGMGILLLDSTAGTSWEVDKTVL